MITRITPRKLNADTDERSLNADEMKYALNISVDANTDGDGAVVKCSEGNLASLSSDELGGVLDGINTVIGSVADEELGVVYLFVHNTSGNHGVYAYSEKTDTYRLIFTSPTLDFDQDGFVKGDVVRVKRLTELAPIEILEGQGSEGGAVIEDDGPVIEGPDPVLSVPIDITIERDLMPLVELHADVHDAESALSSILPNYFSATVVGTVDTSNLGARRQNIEPVLFYEENEDTNIGEFASESFSDVQFTVQQVGRKLSLVAECTVYLRPQHVDNASLSLQMSVRYNAPVPLQDWTSGSESTFNGGAVQSVIPGGSISNSSTSGGLTEDIVLDNSQFTGSSFSNEGGFFLFPGISAENLKASVLFSLPPQLGLPEGPTFNEIESKWLFRELNKKLSSLSVVEGENSLSFGEERPLSERVMPVVVEIDYTPSQAYQKAIEVAEFLDYFNGGDGPDDWETSTVADFRGSDLRSAPSALLADPTPNIEFFFATTCAYTFGYKLYFMSGVQVPRTNPDTNQLYSYSALVDAAEQDPNWGLVVYPVDSDGTLLFGTNTNPNPVGATFGSFSQMTFAASQALGGTPFFVSAGAGQVSYNFAIVEGVAGAFETALCPSYEPQDFFVPTLHVAPASQEALNARDIKTYTPFNKPQLAEDATTQDFVNYFGNPIFKYLIEVPVSSPMDGPDYDSIICAYNDSDLDLFRGPETVIPSSGYNYEIYSEAPQLTGKKLVSNQVLEEILNLPNITEYSYNFNASGPQDAIIVQGRRVRVQIKDNDSVDAVAGSAIMPRGQFNITSNNYDSIRCTPSSEISSDPFCFASGVSCDAEARQISLLAPPEVLPPPVINQGDVVVQDDDTSSDSGGDSAGDSGPTQPDTTQPVRPVSDAIPNVATTNTRTTIKKRY